MSAEVAQRVLGTMPGGLAQGARVALAVQRLRASAASAEAAPLALAAEDVVGRLQQRLQQEEAKLRAAQARAAPRSPDPPPYPAI